MRFMRGRATRSEVQQALHSGESESLKFIDGIYSVEIEEVATGMANSGGGLIVYGVGKEKFSNQTTVVGVDDPERVLTWVKRKLAQIEPPIKPEINIDSTDDSTVVIIEISPFQGLPHAVDGRFLIRKGTTTEPLGPQELKGLFEN